MAAEKLKLEERVDRVETGAVQFEYANGDVDWNGYFIRGDNAFAIADDIEQLLAGNSDALSEMRLAQLMKDIKKNVPN